MPKITRQEPEILTLIWGLCRSVFNMIIEYARTKTASSFFTSAKIREVFFKSMGDITQLTRFVRHEVCCKSVSYACDLLRFSREPEGLQQFSQRLRNTFLINAGHSSPKVNEQTVPRTFLKSKRPMNASSTSSLSGFEIKSPSIRLSIRAQVLRNSAKLCGRGTSGSA